MNKRDNIEYYVSLTEKGSVKMEYGTSLKAEVTIPIDILFNLTKQLLESGVAHDYISEDVLSDIHDYL